MKTSILLALCISLASVGCASTQQGGIFGSHRPSQANFDQELSLARLSERQNKQESAERIYYTIAKEQPDNVVANHRLGVLSAKRGLHDDAAKYFQTAEAAGLRSAEFYNDFGYYYYLKNDTVKAESYFKKSLAVDSSYRATHNNLGLLTGEQQRYDESLKHFLLAVNEAEAHANLAFIQSQMGDMEAAEGNYHRALTINPELKRAAQALIQIAEMRGSVTPVEQNRRNLEKKSPDQLVQSAPQAKSNVAKVAAEQSVALPTENAVPTQAEQVAPVSYEATNQSAAKSAEMQQQFTDMGQASLETKVESSMTSKSGLHYPQIMSIPPSLTTNQIQRSLESHPTASKRLGFAENTLRGTSRSE